MSGRIAVEGYVAAAAGPLRAELRAAVLRTLSERDLDMDEPGDLDGIAAVLNEFGPAGQVSRELYAAGLGIEMEKSK